MSAILSTVEFQVSLLLFVALAGYLLAARINQSAIIGEILVGILIGPSFLGLITYTNFVQSLAHLGAVILLFVVGLEFRLRDILQKRYFVIALFGVLLPWVAGYLISRSFGIASSSAIFIGTALTATSIAITANVLREMGKLQTEAAKAIIGAAVIDDVLGLLALSVSTQVTSGNISLLATVLVLAKAAGFLVIGILVGNKLLQRIVVRLDNTELVQRYPEFIFIFAIMAAFLYGLVAEIIGLSAIVGAFIAGVALTEVGLHHSKSVREGADFLRIIFAAIFFVSLGILVDIHALSWGIIGFLAVLTIGAILTKLVGCGVPALLSGMGWRDSLIVGFGMSPRGEVAMIVALLGLNAAIIGQDIYVAIVFMSLLTTIITPILLRNWLYREAKMG